MSENFLDWACAAFKPFVLSDGGRRWTGWVGRTGVGCGGREHWITAGIDSPRTSSTGSSEGDWPTDGTWVGLEPVRASWAAWIARNGIVRGRSVFGCADPVGLVAR